MFFLGGHLTTATTSTTSTTTTNLRVAQKAEVELIVQWQVGVCAADCRHDDDTTLLALKLFHRPHCNFTPLLQCQRTTHLLNLQTHCLIIGAYTESTVTSPPVANCHCFPPGPQSIAAHWPMPNYTAR